MSITKHAIRNTQYVFVLVLALGLLVACNGPTVRGDKPAPGSDVGKYAVDVRVDPPSLQIGQKATINYAFTDTSLGKQAADLPLVNDATVHTTLVNRDLTWFRTGQSTGPVSGAYPVNLRFGGPDSYRLYAEFTSGYTPTVRLLYKHTISFGNNPPSLEQPARLAESPSRTNAFYGVGVTLDTGSGPIRAGQPALFHYTLNTGGKPVTDLGGFDGALGHLYVVSADGETFAHLMAREAATGTMNGQREPTEGGGSGSSSGNPASSGGNGTPAPAGTPAATTPTAEATAAATAAPVGGQAGPTAQAGFNLGTNLGPDLTFDYKFEKPGLYKTWLQFLYHGQIVTADYVVRVEQ
ncbi:MAG: hypothetical protein M3010_04650 [Candidatus Dormibacteraeota bacterium]|nr:hypothetical protein [Candidatus Dormibacteraeota bacterium]